jgi:hypothetical protein
MSKDQSILIAILILPQPFLLALIAPSVGGSTAFIVGFVCGIIGAILILPHIFLKQQQGSN